MKIALAKILSYVLHPAIIPLLGLAVIFLFSPFYIQPQLFLLVAIYIFLGTYIFPLIIMLFFKRLGAISSLELRDASERVYPYLTSALFFFLTAYSISDLPMPIYVAKYLYAGVIIVGIALFFLKHIKISMHMAGMGGLTALAIFISYSFSIQLLWVICFFILLSGLLGTARLLLNAHKPAEVYFGYLLGLFSVLVGLIWI